MKEYKLFHLILILTPFVFSFAFGLDIYVPIIPQMTQIFKTTPALVQLTLSLFLLGTGIGQLFVGPLSDQFGRKKVFYASSLLFTIGSLACAFSPTIIWLIIARILASLGACGMLVTAFALVRDLYGGEESGQIYSYLNGAIGISPTFAPILGGYLNLYFGWQSVFYFLALLGCCSFLMTGLQIKETHEKQHRVKMDRKLFYRFGSIFQNRQFLIYSCIAGFGEAVFFCFFSISPFIIIDLLKVPPHEFGYYFAFFGAVVGLGGLGGGKMIKWLGIETTVKSGLALMLGGGILMVAWYGLAPLSLISFLLPMTISCTGAIFVVGGSASAALEPFPAIAGTASAGFGALEFGISAIAGALLMLFPVNSTLPYGITIVLMALLSSLLFVQREKLPNRLAA